MCILCLFCLGCLVFACFSSSSFLFLLGFFSTPKGMEAHFKTSVINNLMARAPCVPGGTSGV